MLRHYKYQDSLSHYKYPDNLPAHYKYSDPLPLPMSHHYQYPDPLSHYKYPDPLPLPLPHHYKYPHPDSYKYPHPDSYKYPHPDSYKYPLDLAHYEDVDHLITELEGEKRHKDKIEWANGELERSVTELETYYRELKEDRLDVDDNEWKTRFEAQTELNKQLGEQREWLESELSEVRRKLTTGSYPEANKYNLDSLNEPELLRLVKHLERTRNGLYSSLRDMEWKLDKESKEFRNFDEIRRTIRNDLKQVNHALERMQWSRVVEPNGILSPIYPPGYLHHWLDPPSGGYGNIGVGTYPGATKSRKGGVAKQNRGPSPPRSKSRAEKKTKKKEIPPPEEPKTSGGGGGGGGGGRNGTSETDNAAEDVFDGGKDESNPSSGADTYVKESEALKQKRKSSKERSASHAQE